MEDDYGLEFGLIPEGRRGQRTADAPMARPVIAPRYQLRDLTPEQLLLIQQGYLDAGGSDVGKAINIYNEGVVLGDPGEVGSSDEFINIEYNEEGIPTDFVMDPSLIGTTLIGSPVIEDVEGGGGATASPETEGTPQPEAEPEATPNVDPGFSDDAGTSESTYDPTKQYEQGDVITDVQGNEWEYQPYDPRLPGYWGWVIKEPTPEIIAEYEAETGNTYEEGDNIWVIGNPSNPLDIPTLEDDPDYTYVDPELEPEETTTPAPSGPSIVITAPPSSAAPTTPSDVVIEEPAGAETPSDTADTGTDQAGQEGQQGTDTGGTGGGSAGSGGDGTGDGDGSGDGGMLSRTAKSKDYFDSIEYQPVAVPNLILPNQPINTSIVPVRSRRDSFMDSSIVASMFKDLI